MRGWYEISLVPCSASHIINILHQMVPLLQSMTLPHNHSKSMAYMRIHSWCCPSSVDFDKCIMVLFIHYNIHYHDVIWIVFTALKILCASSGLPSSKLPTSRQPLVFLLSLIVLPVPECYIVANVQPFHIGFLYFHGLTVYFVLVLFHCLDVCQFVYPFTY